MNDQIVCPYCRKSIPLTEALTHQLQEKYQRYYKKRLEEEKEKIEMELVSKLRKKIKDEVELTIKDKNNEVEELKKQNTFLETQLLDLTRSIRKLHKENQERQLELEKKLIIEQERIRLDEKKRFDEEYRFKLLEKDKKLQDAIKMNEDLRRKLEQGSQQTQGEVLELEIETNLKNEFPEDDILPVPKGIRGADIIQVVKTLQGKVCGKIIWESKRTKSWSDSWVKKLKEDQRQMHAETAVLISHFIPSSIKTFGLMNDIWVGTYDSVIGLAYVLRKYLQEITLIRQATTGKEEKMEVLFHYLSGTEFKQRIEAIIEAFTVMQGEIEKEKRWFSIKWAREEKNIRKVIENTLGMHGDLQGIMGKAIGEIKEIEALGTGEKEQEELL